MSRDESFNDSNTLLSSSVQLRWWWGWDSGTQRTHFRLWGEDSEGPSTHHLNPAVLYQGCARLCLYFSLGNKGLLLLSNSQRNQCSSKCIDSLNWMSLRLFFFFTVIAFECKVVRYSDMAFKGFYHSFPILDELVIFYFF